MSQVINERHQNILTILRKEKRYVTAAELAASLKVSKKTIYRDIQQIIEANLMPFRIIKKESFGYYLEKIEETLESETIVFDSPDERRLNLLLYLLSIAPCKTSIQKIAEKYIVSQSSILNDFKHIEKELKFYNLRLVRTNEGTFLRGDKLSIYRLMAVIIENYLTQMGDPFSQYDIPDSIKKVKVKNSNLLKIKKLLHEIQVKHDLSLDQPYYLTLFCSLLSIIEKQYNKLSLEEEIVFEEIDNSSNIYCICKDLIDELKKQFSIPLKSFDISSLYYILKAYKLNSRFLLNQDTEQYKNEQVILLTNRLIARVTENSGYRFDTDDELLERLTLHMHAMIYRLSHRIYIINPIIKSIKANFANIFSLVKVSVKQLIEEGHCEKYITDEEIGYMTLYFQISYDDHFANQIPILIECTSGIGTSHLLSEKIRRTFPNIHIKKIIAQQRIKHTDYEDIELVISTVKTHSIIGKPTILVSPILNQEDKFKIDQFIKDYYNQQPIIDEK